MICKLSFLPSSSAAARILTVVLLLLRTPGGLSAGFLLSDSRGGRGHGRVPDEQDMGNPGPGYAQGDTCHVSYGDVFGEATQRKVEVPYIYEIETNRDIRISRDDGGADNSRHSDDIMAVEDDENSSNILRKLEVALNDEIIPVMFEGQCPSRKRRLRNDTKLTTHLIARRMSVEMETVAGLSTSPPDRVLDGVPCNVIKPSGSNFCTQVEGKISFHLTKKGSRKEIQALAQDLINAAMASGALDAGKVDEAIVRVAYAQNDPYKPAPEPTLITPLSLAADSGGGKSTPYIALGTSVAVLGAILVFVGVRMRNRNDQHHEQQQKEITVVGAEHGYGRGGRLSSASVSSLGDNSFPRSRSREELGSAGLAAHGATIETEDEEGQGIGQVRDKLQTVDRQDLDTAIEAGDWAAVGATAALLASEASDSASQVSGASSMYSTSSLCSASSVSSLGVAQAAELDRLVEAGDFEGVVLAAARFEAESRSKSKSKLVSAATSFEKTDGTILTSATSADSPSSKGSML